MQTIDQIARVYLAENAKSVRSDLESLIDQIGDDIGEEDKATLSTAADLLTVIASEALSRKKEFFPTDFETCTDRLYTIGAELPYDTENLDALDRAAVIFYTIAHADYTISLAKL